MLVFRQCGRHHTDVIITGRLAGGLDNGQGTVVGSFIPLKLLLSAPIHLTPPHPTHPPTPKQVLVIPTDEELSIAQQTLEVISGAGKIAAAA